jgi:HSP20 family protein
MAKTVPIQKTHSVFDEMREVQNRIMRRAYEIFSENGIFGRDFENWLRAERELVWKPAFELCEKDGAFRVEIAVPGVEANDIEIEVTPDDVLVRANISHEHREEKGTVHVCEFETGRMFRTIHLPKKIDPDRVKAEFKNGMLNLTAEIAREQRAKIVKVDAA